MHIYRGSWSSFLSGFPLTIVNLGDEILDLVDTYRESSIPTVGCRALNKSIKIVFYIRTSINNGLVRHVDDIPLCVTKLFVSEIEEFYLTNSIRVLENEEGKE